MSLQCVLPVYCCEPLIADHVVAKVSEFLRMAEQMVVMGSWSFLVYYDEILQHLSNCSVKINDEINILLIIF